MQLRNIFLFFFLFLLVLSSTQGALDTDLESYFKFDENNSTQLDSIEVNNATVTSATFTSSGKINGAYTYDRTTPDYMTMINTPIQGTGNKSISVWVKTTYAGTGVITSLGSNVLGRALTMQVEGSGARIGIAVYGGTKSWTTNVIDGNWHHLVLILNGTILDNFVLYKDGALQTVNAVATPSRVIDIGSTTKLIGKQPAGTGWDGELDELAYYNRDLSSSEVSELYNSGDGLQYPFTPPITDSCTYSSGSHTYQGVDDCNITTSVDVGGNAIYCNSTGDLRIKSGGRLWNYSVFESYAGCTTTAINGGMLG